MFGNVACLVENIRSGGRERIELPELGSSSDTAGSPQRRAEED